MARGKTIAMKGSSRAARHPLQTCMGEAGAEPNHPSTRALRLESQDGEDISADSATQHAMWITCSAKKRAPTEADALSIIQNNECRPTSFFLSMRS